MALLQDNPEVQLAFSMAENQGVYALLLGSGLSRSAGIKSGWEIMIDLISRIAKGRGVKDQDDWALWYRNEFGEEPSYSRVLEDAAPTQSERMKLLRGYIEPEAGDDDLNSRRPTAAHKAIAHLVSAGYVRVILTTNFDRLMEIALAEQGVSCSIISSPDDLGGAEPYTHCRCQLLKLSGDYMDTRILNTDLELAEYPEAYEQHLERVFDEFGLVVSGWSGDWDIALRRALLRAPNRRYPFYWAKRGTLTDWGSKVVGHRDGRVVETEGADHFFTELQERVELFEQLRQANPDTVELLVASAKRYVATEADRVRLRDLFERELHRALEQLEAVTSDDPREFNQDLFELRVTQCEAIFEPLGRMMGVLGAHGSDSTLKLAQEVVSRLYAFSQRRLPNPPVRTFEKLWAYPAVLCLTSYCVALTCEERWRLLRDFLRTPAHVEPSAPITFVGMENGRYGGLFLDMWMLGEQVLERLSDIPVKHYAVSYRTLAIMKKWRSSFSAIRHDFEETFMLYEGLGALIQAEHIDASTRLEKYRRRQQEPDPILSLGLASRTEDNTTRMLEKVRDLSSELAHAGFEASSGDALEYFEISYQWQAERWKRGFR